MPLPTCFHLPNELWCEIFENLPREDLRQIHSVSSLFHDISHSIFFRDFILDPDRLDLATDEVIERLALYTSASIATHVRKLKVSFKFGPGFRSSSRNATAPISPSAVSPLLRSIQSFKNVRILECEFRFGSEVHFDDLGLQSLPNLTELRVVGARLYCPRTPTSSKIKVAHFSFSAIPEIVPDERGEADTRCSFLSALDPEALTSLTMSPSLHCSPGAWLANDSDLFPTFRNLQSVTIDCDGPFLRPVHAFLVQLPALQHLTLTGRFCRSTEFTPTPGCSLPRTLQSFTGPAEYIPLFLADTTCTRLAINACCRPDELYVTLLGTPLCVSAVTDFEVHLSLAGVCTWKAPHQLFAAFPKLKTARIRISHPSFYDGGSGVSGPAETPLFAPAYLPGLPCILVAALRACATLFCVVIDWDLRDLAPCLLPDFVALREILLNGLAPRIMDIGFEGNLWNVRVTRRRWFGRVR
ncbi:F-box domain-containing protein [Favolaschia claudopus]|uniref:F-box domain-containing protein n=1 Tax=Favolaschia claudopus TaxID=2862362 RepID=A0AAW0EHJ3_9AGAR